MKIKICVRTRAGKRSGKCVLCTLEENTKEKQKKVEFSSLEYFHFASKSHDQREVNIVEEYAEEEEEEEEDEFEVQLAEQQQHNKFSNFQKRKELENSRKEDMRETCSFSYSK
ncbi:hypothetical protein RUM44_004575 [Polyplax serrata]|uniref:Uncharacterized protein n=1 Tax=Polyplax serrata TaxID=468196 RepID=A0ABR1B390_POLSC